MYAWCLYFLWLPFVIPLTSLITFPVIVLGYNSFNIHHITHIHQTYITHTSQHSLNLYLNWFGTTRGMKQGPRATANLRTSQGCHICNRNAQHPEVTRPAVRFLQIPLRGNFSEWARSTGPNTIHFTVHTAVWPHRSGVHSSRGGPQGAKRQWSAT